VPPQYSDFYVANDLQALDLFHIASRAFSAFGAAIERNGNCMILFIVRCS
jgi:hypothetical protein